LQFLAIFQFNILTYFAFCYIILVSSSLIWDPFFGQWPKENFMFMAKIFFSAVSFILSFYLLYLHYFCSEKNANEPNRPSTVGGPVFLIFGAVFFAFGLACVLLWPT